MLTTKMGFTPRCPRTSRGLYLYGAIPDFVKNWTGPGRNQRCSFAYYDEYITLHRVREIIPSTATLLMFKSGGPALGGKMNLGCLVVTVETLPEAHPCLVAFNDLLRGVKATGEAINWLCLMRTSRRGVIEKSVVVVVYLGNSKLRRLSPPFPRSDADMKIYALTLAILVSDASPRSST